MNGDVLIEPDETFFVTVTNISGATASDGQGQGIIQNDDSPVLSINDVTQTEGNAGTSVFSFTVTSSLPAPAGGITFDIATADGIGHDDNPASEDNDCLGWILNRRVNSRRETSYTFEVTVNGDTKNAAICEYCPCQSDSFTSKKPLTTRAFLTYRPPILLILRSQAFPESRERVDFEMPFST